MRRVVFLTLMALAVTQLALAHGHGHQCGGCGHRGNCWDCGQYGYRLVPPGPSAARPLPSRNAALDGVISNIYSPEGATGQVLDLETDRGSITVFLGPRWFVEQEGWEMKKGDRVHVEGWWEDEATLVAREIRAGERAMRLRRNDGRPLYYNRSRSCRFGKLFMLPWEVR